MVHFPIEKNQSCREFGRKMKFAVQYSRTGNPTEVVDLVEMKTGDLKSDDVLLDVLAAAINPSHLLALSGDYGIQPELPSVPGTEGLGRVIETGSAVTEFRPGDVVMIPPYAGTWRQQVIVSARHIRLKFPPQENVSKGVHRQLAMLMANPPTAWLLLNSVASLGPGDWIVQNAANSAVGQYVMQLASLYGLKTVNVMRRDNLGDLVAQARGDACLVDGDDLADQVSEATGNRDVCLAIDAVAGDATQRLADCLPDGSTVVNYGLLSGEPCRLSPSDIVFRDIRLRGVWLTRWLRDKSKVDEQQKVYEELKNHVMTGRLSVKIDSTYSLERIKEAIAHAAAEGRNGKILLLPNGDI